MLVPVTAVSSEDYNLAPDGAPAPGRVRIDSSGPADRAQSPAPGRGLSAPGLVPAPAPSLAAMAGSAPAPTQATLTPLSAAAASEGALDSASAPAALTAAEGAKVRLAQSSHDTVAPSASTVTSEGVPSLAPEPAPSSSAAAALAVSMPEAQPVTAMSAQDPPMAAPFSSPMASLDEPSPAPVAAMPSAAPAPSASAPVPSAAPQSASAGEAARAAAALSSLGLLSLQATGRIHKLPHGTAGSAACGSTAPPGELSAQRCPERASTTPDLPSMCARLAMVRQLHVWCKHPRLPCQRAECTVCRGGCQGSTRAAGACAGTNVIPC